MSPAPSQHENEIRQRKGTNQRLPTPHLSPFRHVSTPPHGTTQPSYEESEDGTARITFSINAALPIPRAGWVRRQVMTREVGVAIELWLILYMMLI